MISRFLMLKISKDGGSGRKSWRRGRNCRKTKKAVTNIDVKPAIVNKELACLRSLINYFIRTDYFMKNPVSRVKFLKEDNEQTSRSEP